VAITINEKVGSRTTTEGDNPSIELVYIIDGSTDDIACKIALDAYAPGTYDGLAKKSLHLDPVNNRNGRWTGTVRYGIYTRPETNDNSYTFDTTGGTTKITQSLATVNAYAPDGKSAPDFQGAIGFDGKTIQGCDITVANYKWTETHYVPLQFVGAVYRNFLANMSGTVNDAPFRDHFIGEVLFLGAVGSQRGVEDWEIQYNFIASPTLLNLSVGEITGIVKGGWDYLWVLYEEIDDDTSSKLISVPRAAYVEKVYMRSNFANLGIGVSPI
jgi:hypothetical protein